MSKLIPVLLLCFSCSALEAQDIFKKKRPWDPAWRAAYSNQVARLKSDSMAIIVRKGDMEATIEDTKGREQSLESLLDNLHGRVVVLVTWNKNCPGEFYTFLDMFPLMEEFEKQPVSFVFLNTFNRKEDWKVYSSSGRVSEIEHNYRLTDADECQFLRTFGNGRSTTMLIDRQGRLCNAYAPSPEDGLAGYIRNMLKDDQFGATTK